MSKAEDKNEKEKEFSSVHTQAVNIFGSGYEEYWDGNNLSGRKFSPNHEATVGICANCQSYEYAENDVHQIIHSRCSDFRRPLGASRITQCSNFAERGQLSLRTMFDMAVLIDAPKRKAGF